MENCDFYGMMFIKTLFGINIFPTKYLFLFVSLISISILIYLSHYTVSSLLDETKINIYIKKK